MNKLSILVTAISMSAALLSASPSFAVDHMMGGMAVPADKVEAVQAKCDELKAAAPTQTLTDSTDATTDNMTGSDAGATGSDIDMDKITMEMCVEGGFIPAS